MPADERTPRQQRTRERCALRRTLARYRAGKIELDVLLDALGRFLQPRDKEPA